MSAGQRRMTAGQRVAAAFERIAAVDRPEVWIALRPREEAMSEATQIDARVAAGKDLPLAGRTLAVKDNIDVGGLPTTAGCPAFAYHPSADAPVVARLRAAGAVVVGKTNMDQFATGLVGTRTPYGAVRDARRPAYVSGGSSAGSAVAVALGMSDLALGTDTAGSGRVPAAFGGIVGLKPTRGLVPNVGVVPACRTLDCVTVFAPGLAEAEEAMAVMAASGVVAGLEPSGSEAAIIAGPANEPADPRARAWPSDAPLGAPPSPRVAVPRELPELGETEVEAFRAACARLSAAGARLVEVDPAPFLEAAQLLYGGGFAAERYQGVGHFVDDHADEVDPVVGSIIQAAGRIPAYALVADGKRLDELRLEALTALEGCDALLVPTAPFQPTLEAVAADPVGVNSRLGTYTNFCNLFDLSAASVPAGRAGEAEFGVTVLARPFADRIACDVARLLADGPPPVRVAGPPATELMVVGAHLTGQPLNHQLTGRGARLVGLARTAPEYRLYALDTEPPKPGLVRVADGGAAVEGELWALPPAALGTLLAGLPTPMTLGRVQLHDGRAVTGFLCEGVATEGALDITASGKWVAYLQGA